MTDFIQEDIQDTLKDTGTEVKKPSKDTLNKQKIRLLFPYDENPKYKKMGVKWDVDKKIWYFPSLDGELPENLKPLKCYTVAIDYDDKEFYKPLFPSMRWDKNIKNWIVDQTDYNKFISY